MREYLGLGVIGNFADHLEQAGEADYFIDTDESAPKGIFPFYVPNNSTFLGRYCLDDTKIIVPNIENPPLQAEPEIAIKCDISYQNNQIRDIVPADFMAFNDASIRNGDVCSKLSEKKNFSIASKGYGQTIHIDTFENGEICDKYTLSSFVIIDGEMYQYGNNAKLTDYNYFYKKLIVWLVEQINTQQNAGVLEKLSTLIANANFPTKAIIDVGSTSYTKMGKTRFLKEGDEICVVAYNSTLYTHSQIKEMVRNNITNAEETSILRQQIIKDIQKG